MRRTIGLVELNSIAKGIEVGDAMLKTAAVKLIFSKTVCPGKYIVLISGDVAAVKASIEEGVKIGKNFVVDKLIIANVHEQVIPAINGVVEVNEVQAVGVVEYFNIASAIVGGDIAVKTADVRLIEIRLGIAIGGKAFVVMCGDVSSVQSAVAAAIKEASLSGTIVSSCVIPSPVSELFYGLL